MKIRFLSKAVALIGAARGGLGGVAASTGAGAIGGALMTKSADINLAPGAILRIRFERPRRLPSGQHCNAKAISNSINN